MRILMTGGTGFIGRRLIETSPNHQFVVYSRQKSPQFRSSNTETINSLQKLNSLDEFDAVINLSGEPIVGKRWSDSQKQKIRSSRIDITRQLVALFQQSSKKPSVFLSGSAIGIYGNTGDLKIDEFSQFAKNESDFAQTLCLDWESEASKAPETRIVHLRTGIVLGHGGALAQMLPAFRLGLGGPLATGKQYMSWIHIDDIVSAICTLLAEDTIEGPVNLVAPTPIVNAEFTQSLAKACRRWAPFRVPKFMLKLLLGESSQLLTDSQRIYPTQLLNSGFEFKFGDINKAFDDLKPSN